MIARAASGTGPPTTLQQRAAVVVGGGAIAGSPAAAVARRRPDHRGADQRAPPRRVRRHVRQLVGETIAVGAAGSSPPTGTPRCPRSPAAAHLARARSPTSWSTTTTAASSSSRRWGRRPVVLLDLTSLARVRSGGTGGALPVPGNARSRCLGQRATPVVAGGGADRWHEPPAALAPPRVVRARSPIAASPPASWPSTAGPHRRGRNDEPVASPPRASPPPARTGFAVVQYALTAPHRCRGARTCSRAPTPTLHRVGPARRARRRRRHPARVSQPARRPRSGSTGSGGGRSPPWT